MNLNLDFLKNVELEVPERKEIVRSTANKTPEGGLLLRVFASGKIYPSRELAARYGLEYTEKDSEVKANGLDVFKSSDWPMFPATSEDKYIFIAPVNKKLPKVDLFSQVGYDKKGQPKNSVMEQGGGSFGSTLVEMIKEVYGVEIPKGEYLDLEVKSDIVVKSPNDVYYVPKTITRGEKKGQITVVRRENIEVMPLVPVFKTQDTEPTPVEDTPEEEVSSYDASQEEPQTTVEEVPGYMNEAPFDTKESEDAVSDDIPNGMPNIPGLE